MSEFTLLREAVESLADHAPAPDFGDLKRRATRRGRRRLTMIAAVAAAVIAGSALAVSGLDEGRRTAPPVDDPPPKLGVAPNGWVAVDAYQGGGDIFLARRGEDARRLEVAGSEAASDACPAWSPDGYRLLFGRVSGASDAASGAAQLVIASVDQSGAAGTPTVIELDGFAAQFGFDPHPCATWASDGRWVAFSGAAEVWLVDTQTGTTRHLPDLRPSDLEWRPGTDELAIAGDVGTYRGAPTLDTPVTVYSVSSGETRQLGSVEAAHISWSPDGSSLAYTGGEREPETRELDLVDADGTHQRSLVDDLGPALHGIGPVWSPRGDRIAFQRCAGELGAQCSGESHEVVLVSVADGTETVIEPPTADGHEWYPFTVSWSPDGTTLLYTGWGLPASGPRGESLPGGVIAVPADTPGDATVLIDGIDPVPDYYSHRWSPIQMWGRQAG